jgi:hypothetical protein
MPRFLLRLSCFIALQSIIAAMVFCYGSPLDSNHYLRSFQDKLARLEDCDGNRLIIAGGSNAAFGVHSRTLQETIGMPTVNLGLHMSLGLRFPVECVRRHGRRGDVVVLTPEYQLLTSHIQDGDPVTIHQLLEQWPQSSPYFDQSRYASWKRFFDHDGLWKAHQWVKRSWSVIRGRETKSEIYQRSSFNEFGDVVAHYGRTSNTMMQTEPLPRIDQERLDMAIEYLNSFAEDCRRRGIAVYFSYPPLPDVRFDSSSAIVKAVDRELQSRLEMPLLNRPQEVVFPLDNFFDTTYHLSEAGGVKRTQVVADALLARRRIASTAAGSDWTAPVSSAATR